ncbi:hypothetical protein PVT01_000056100 [Plasmodium vivax]|uniref:VIR protein n=1 Tax=Plasmodium vivax TaxID=5855 RepID=A0A1G4E6U1_PLAVI|nr:hypothetical protein PVT01_000056100 [Plasmodium vivax]
MPDSTPEPEYFKDKDYIELKNKFESNIKIKNDDDFTNNFLQTKKNEIINLQLFEKIIRHLREYLTKHHIFYTYGKDNFCRYINFWLNREFRSFNNLKYESNFNLFKEFELGFSLKYYRNDKNACKEILYYIDPVIYEKMATMYKLYELYDKLKSHNLKEDDRCDPFGNMISIYNQALEKYDNEDRKDYKLIEKLYHLKNLTVKSILTPDTICPHRKRQFNEPNLYLNRLNEDEIKKQEVELQMKKQEELQSQKEQIAKEELERQKSQKLLQGEQHGNKELLGNRETLLSASLTEHRETGQSFDVESTGSLGYRARHEFERPLEFLSEQQEQLEWGHSEFKDQKRDASTTSGITGTITETISGFIKEVEPAPILGVSGGMGALFLLFKYTPVGTFFRGGRVRARRIPSGFSGPFLGEFPDIQYYYGGNIGYGQMNPLAE